MQTEQWQVMDMIVWDVNRVLKNEENDNSKQAKADVMRCWNFGKWVWKKEQRTKLQTWRWKEWQKRTKLNWRRQQKVTAVFSNGCSDTAPLQAGGYHWGTGCSAEPEIHFNIGSGWWRIHLLVECVFYSVFIERTVLHSCLTIVVCVFSFPN